MMKSGLSIEVVAVKVDVGTAVVVDFDVSGVEVGICVGGTSFSRFGFRPKIEDEEVFPAIRDSCSLLSRAASRRIDEGVVGGFAAAEVDADVVVEAGASETLVGIPLLLLNPMEENAAVTAFTVFLAFASSLSEFFFDGIVNSFLASVGVTGFLVGLIALNLLALSSRSFFIWASSSAFFFLVEIFLSIAAWVGFSTCFSFELDSTSFLGVDGDGAISFFKFICLGSIDNFPLSTLVMDNFPSFSFRSFEVD